MTYRLAEGGGSHAIGVALAADAPRWRREGIDSMKTDTYDQRAAKVAAAAQAYAKAARADRPRGQVEVELLQAVADLIGVGVQRVNVGA